MYGVDTWDTTDDDYDPWTHAQQLGLHIITVALPQPLNGAYDPYSDRIYLHHNLSARHERSVLAHEIVHAEHGDHGRQPAAERRADRTALKRLVKPTLLANASKTGTPNPSDLGISAHLYRLIQDTL